MKFRLVDFLDCSVEAFNHCYYGPVLIPYLVKTNIDEYQLDKEAMQRDLADGSSLLAQQAAMVFESLKEFMKE